MATHDTQPIDQADETPDAAGAEIPREQALPEDSPPEFRISVRKVQVKVQCRGVLAE